MSNHHIPRHSGIYYFSSNATSGQRYNPDWLPQVSQSSLTKLHNTSSCTCVSQTFVNPSNESPITSAKYTFPLYESCAVVSFRCYVGALVIDGIVKEKEEASARYQEAIDLRTSASLLEQHAPDVFSIGLGNVPPGETVKVEIEYIMELKHDAKIDGLRFTIPTSIAPRYGDPPSGLNMNEHSLEVAMKGINISVEITMPSNITSVQSPSHPISMYLGGHTEDTPDNAFNPQRALATLGQTSTELGRDFILLVKCTNLSSPCALLETHPTIPNSHALMVTLVPKFRLPEASMPEIVFIVDRSGSMTDRVAPLKSSLSVFLKSLPLGVRFNICSFGTRHSFLWPRSRPYSNESLGEAKRYVDMMEANFGGTEILPPIRSTIANRLNDLMLEIMVLTDGQVWDSEQLFKFVEQETAKGDVRLFSLGIGLDVSHSLVDGIARVGRGFSQVVSDEREGMEGKVARMLRGALSAHINDYRLEWEGKPNEEYPGNHSSSPVISLYDNSFDEEPSVSPSRPPEFVIPSVLQAPYKLPSLFPFSRSTAYAILSTDVPPPSRVWLRGTTPSGNRLELEIPVQPPQQGKTIHQLAARKILQELEEGTGYVHSGRYGVWREIQPMVFSGWVKREGMRVGLKYGLPSKWTSFLAVLQTTVSTEANPPPPPPPPPGDTSESSQNDLDDEDMYEFIDPDVGGEAGVNGAAMGGSVPTMMAFMPPPPAIDYPTKSSKYSKYSKSPSSQSEKGVLPLPAKDKNMKSPAISSFSKLYSSSMDSLEVAQRLAQGDDTKLLPGPPYSKQSSYVVSLAPKGVQRPRDVMKSSSLSPYSKQSSYLVSSVPKDAPPPVEGGDMKSSSLSPYSKKYSPPTPPTSQSITPYTPQSVTSPPLPLCISTTGEISEETTMSDNQPFGKALSALSLSVANLAPPSLQLQDREPPYKGNQLCAPDIAITYSPSSAPPSHRLDSETGVLSLRTKALIALQTYEGSFPLGPALAALLGVPIVDLEAKLANFALSYAGLSQEHRRGLWATVLAIKLFKTKLAGERSVWVLVVQKAKAWIQGLANVGNAEIVLEKLAGEVLGV